MSACEGHLAAFGSIKWEKLAEGQFPGRSKLRLVQVWGWYKKLVSGLVSGVVVEAQKIMET